GQIQGRIRLFEAHTGKLIKDLTPDKDVEAKNAAYRTSPARAVLALGWSPDGKHLMSAGWDGAVRLWNIADGKTIRILDRTEDGVALGQLRAAAWSADGKYVAAGGDHGICWMWHADSAKLVGTLAAAPRSMAWSPDHKTLALGTSDGTVKLWQPAAPKDAR